MAKASSTARATKKSSRGGDEMLLQLSRETIGKIIDIHRIIDRLFQCYYEEYGITSVQIPVIMTLVKHERLRVSQLAQILHIGSSNITPLCKRLEKSGLIKRSRDMYDQRVVYVSLTDKAMAIFRDISSVILTVSDPDSDSGVHRVTLEELELIDQGVDMLHRFSSKLLLDRRARRFD